MTISILVVVTLVWLSDYLAQFIIEGWEYDATIGGIFMGTVGVTLVVGRKNRRLAEDGDSGGGDPEPGAADVVRAVLDRALPPPPPPRSTGSHRSDRTTRRATDDEGTR